MRRVVAVLFVCCMLAAGHLFAAVPARAQDQERDLREAGFTAQEILNLAFERKFNAMYDRIHPDAQAVAPRAAVVGAFEAAYGQTDAGQGTVVDGRMTGYTWPVTGKEYPYAAEITFEQPYTDGNGRQQTLRDRMYLVKAGEWRWFFGSSPEAVEQAIAAHGGVPTEPLVEGDLVVNVATDLDVFYADVLSYTDATYESPGFVYVRTNQGVQTACGPAETGFWGFFCPGDNTIYVDESLITTLEEKADFAAAFVIAHEFAHYIQTFVGFERVQGPNQWNELWSIELELMADCMAGAWTLDADTRGVLEPDDVEEAVNFAVETLGDPQYIDQYDPQAHGTGDQRRQAFLLGYDEGFSGCNIVV